MREWVKAFAQLALRKTIFGLSYLLVMIEPEQPPYQQSEEKEKEEPTELPKAPAPQVHTLQQYNILPLNELPMCLLVGEYFTMPTEFRIYQRLVDMYRNEMLGLIANEMQCNESKAEIALISMEHWIRVLKAGELPIDSDTAWIRHYATMSLALDGQVHVTLRERARIVHSLLNSNLEDLNTLQGPQQVVDAILSTGELPNSASLVALDLLAFANTPSMVRKRVEIFNGKLGTNIKAQGALSLN